MALAPKELYALLEKAFPHSQILMEDTAGDQDHYAVTVISEAFCGQSLVKRHQMVYGALEGRMGTVLHALSLKTLTPDEVSQ